MTMSPDRNAPLAMDAAEFRALGHQLVDQIAASLAAIPAGPITRPAAPSAIRAALGLDAGLPEHGTAADALLRDTTQGLFQHSLFNAHPRFFGYITGAPSPIGMLGDFIASALNANAGAWILSPAASELEAQAVRWVAEFIGYDPTCGGLFVSGGNMANIVGFLSARHAARSRVRTEGVDARLRVYASAETHTWIQKAVDLTGMGADAIRWIPADAHLRMDVAALTRQIDADTAAGHVPFLVVGTAGTVSTGAVDPLREIAALCKARGLWFHVDGAYGGFAAAVAEDGSDLKGLALADSVAIDPHKWLYAPLEAGCVLVRDREAMRSTFSHHPPYYHFDESVTNFVDYGLQNSRGFRALKVWLAFKQVGAAGFRQMIGDDILLAKTMADAVSRHPELELFTQDLSITTFRYVPPALRASVGQPDTERQLDTINQAIRDRLQHEGELFVSHAVLGGRTVLRACIVNFHTTQADVEAVPEIVARVGRIVAGAQ
jgi:aromatic-L-amino-acid decarboxylase